MLIQREGDIMEEKKMKKLGAAFKKANGKKAAKLLARIAGTSENR